MTIPGFLRCCLVLVAFASGLTLLATPASADEPTIDPGTYEARRDALLDSLGEGAAIVYSDGSETEIGHRVNSDFWYLTGFNEPGAILFLSATGRERDVLLLAARNPDVERWEGLRPEITDSLTEALGFDRIRRTSYLDRQIVKQMKHDQVLHYVGPLVGPGGPLPKELELYRKITARVPGASIQNSSRFLENLRMIKSDDEIAMVRQAIEVTGRGITDLLALAKPGATEFELDGALEASFKRQGAQFLAFGPIVGSGVQSTVLHYRAKQKTLQQGDILLLDVGAEWGHYCADISRTVPIDGKFTPEQAEIYDIVLEAQEKAIAAVRPGVTIHDVHQVARSVIREYGYEDYFMHGTSHHLGLDVHDVADYSQPLRPGMIITVEPGIYLEDEEIGVRIEDDILVTRDGRVNLSADIPRTRAEVEAWIVEAKKQAD